MFNNFGVKWKLGIGFSAVVGLFIITLLVMWVAISSLANGVRRMNDESLPLVLAVDQMDLSRSEVQQFLTDVSATHDPDDLEKVREYLMMVTDLGRRAALVSVFDQLG